MFETVGDLKHKCCVTIVGLHQTALKILTRHYVHMNFDLINYRTSFPFPLTFVLLFVNFLSQIQTHSRSTIFSYNKFSIFFFKVGKRLVWRRKKNIFIENAQFF